MKTKRETDYDNAQNEGDDDGYNPYRGEGNVISPALAAIIAADDAKDAIRRDLDRLYRRINQITPGEVGSLAYYVPSAERLAEIATVSAEIDNLQARMMMPRSL